MLFWEEPVVCAFVRVGTTVAGGEIDHVHVHTGLPPHGRIHLIHRCFFCVCLPRQRWRKRDDGASRGTLFRIDRCWVYSSTVQDPRPSHCWRLVSLLEYLEQLGDGGAPDR